METINAILIAAAEILEDYGYAHATTDRIAERAGVSIGSVYQYFGNKLELFECMLDREADLIISGLQRHAIDQSADSHRDVHQFLKICAGCITPGQLRELKCIPELREKINNLSNVVISNIANFVGEFQPDLEERERRIKAELIVVSAQGLGVRDRDKQRHSELTNEFYVMIDRYLARDPACQQPPRGTPAQRSKSVA